MNIISDIFSSKQYSSYFRKYLSNIQHCAVFFLTFLSSVQNFRYFKQWAVFQLYAAVSGILAIFNNDQSISYLKQWPVFQLYWAVSSVFMTRTTCSHFLSLSVISPRRIIKRSIHIQDHSYKPGRHTHSECQIYYE